MAQLKYVLENKKGQVIRVFSWENENLTLVFREDTKRVEAADIEQLKKDEIPFQVILSAKKTQIDKKSVNVEGVGTLRLIEKEETFTPNYTLQKDDSEENFKTIFKRSAIAQIAVSILLVGVGAYFGTKQATEQTTVTVLPQEVVEKMIQEHSEVKSQKPQVKSRQAAVPVPKSQQPKVVAPIDSKHPQRKIAHGKARGGFKGPGKMGFGTNEPNMNSMGALNALDKISKTGRGNGGSGGTNMAAVGNGPGSGAGGKGYGGFGHNGGGGHGAGGIGGGGKMGLANSMYGKGLIAAPFGNGSPAPGYGGYGTRGKAGGGEAGVGYGRTSLVGSSKGLGPKGNGPAGSGGGGSGYGWGDGDGDDAMVQGGLTLDQIEAIIMRNMGQITYCYEQGLQQRPDLSGRVRVKFMIGQQGRVTTAGIASSSVKSSKVESCIVNRLQAWNFPHPVGGVSVKVVYPFTLRRVGQN